jgi:signal transduction histidine kinase/ligand-binding sensor domain-containing protein
MANHLTHFCTKILPTKQWIVYRLVFLFLIGIYSSLPADAQLNPKLHSQWKFEYLTVDEGLSNNSVRSICEDKYGYIWIATSYGLNRFDGISVKKFFHEKNDHTSLNSNFVTQIFLASDGSFWIGTDKGLLLFDDRLDQFIPIDLNGKSMDIRVFDIGEDRSGHLLISTFSGFYSCDLQSKKVTKFDLMGKGLPSDSTEFFAVDDKNNIWLHCFKSGLFFFDRIEDKLTEIASYHTAMPKDEISLLQFDARNRLWVGSLNSGLWYLDPNDSTLRSMYINSELYSKRVRAVFEDVDGRFFVGTRGGLYLYDSLERSFSLYAYDSHQLSKLSQNSVNCSFIDRTGNIWIGTHSGGANYVDMHQKKFVHYPFVLSDNNFLNTRSVQCFAESEQKLYVGTDRGINILDKIKDNFTYNSYDQSDPKSVTFNDVKSIAVETEDSIWIATNGGGLNLMNKQGEIFAVYNRNPEDNRSLPSNKLYNVLLDFEKKLWVISNANPDLGSSVLSRLNRANGQFVHYHQDFYQCIYQSADKRLFVGGLQGFFIYDRENDQFIEVRNELLIDHVYALHLDKENILWIGSSQGLAKYDLKAKSFVDFETEALVGEVYGILEDGKNLWISTNDGLIEILEIYNRAKKMTIRKFDQRDGLQSREFNFNAYFESENGRFYFGGDNGFNTFFPEKILNNPYSPRIQFSSLKIEGKEVLAGQKIEGKVIIENNLKYTSQISIPYQVKTFTISFDGLHYANASDNSYRYKLENKDTEWNYLSALNNSITFQNLPYGEYELVVYAINSDGSESVRPIRLKIDIMRPFWDTIWFEVLSLMLLVLAIIAYLRMRTRTLKRQKLELSDVIAKRTKELQNERDHLEKTMAKLVESEKMASLGIFTAGIAHEINNPINYISGNTFALFQIIREHQEKNPDLFGKEDTEQLLKIEKYVSNGVERISGIVDSLKNFTRQDNPEFVNYNVIRCIDDAITITEHKTKGRIEIIREYPDFVTIECMPSKLSQVFINLIDNAADAMVGEGTIWISVLEKKKHLRVSVRDNGHGISSDDIKTLFDPFFTTKEVGKGTGLGLYLSHGFVTQHGGDIKVKSEMGLGTEFIIELPYRQKFD